MAVGLLAILKITSVSLATSAGQLAKTILTTTSGASLSYASYRSIASAPALSYFPLPHLQSLRTLCLLLKQQPSLCHKSRLGGVGGGVSTGDVLPGAGGEALAKLGEHVQGSDGPLLGSGALSAVSPGFALCGSSPFWRGSTVSWCASTPRSLHVSRRSSDGTQGS